MVTADRLGTSPKQTDGWMDGLTEEGTEPRQKELVRVQIGLAGWPDRRTGGQMARQMDDRQGWAPGPDRWKGVRMGGVSKNINDSRIGDGTRPGRWVVCVAS